MSGGGERITVASLLAGEGAQVVKSEDGQVGNKLLIQTQTQTQIQMVGGFPLPRWSSRKMDRSVISELLQIQIQVVKIIKSNIRTVWQHQASTKSKQMLRCRSMCTRGKMRKIGEGVYSTRTANENVLNSCSSIYMPQDKQAVCINASNQVLQ